MFTTPRHLGNWLQPKKVWPCRWPFFATRSIIAPLHLGQVGVWMRLAVWSVASSITGSFSCGLDATISNGVRNTLSAISCDILVCGVIVCWVFRLSIGKSLGSTSVWPDHRGTSLLFRTSLGLGVDSGMGAGLICELGFDGWFGGLLGLLCLSFR